MSAGDGVEVGSKIVMSDGRPFSSIEDNLFGVLAVRYHFVLQSQVEEALEAQQSFYIPGSPSPKLGELLAQKGYITHEQIAAVLRGQNMEAAQRKRFGEIAVSRHFCSQAEIDAAAKVQEDLKMFAQNPQRIGEILVTRGALRPHQLVMILQHQGVISAEEAANSGTRPRPASLPPPPQPHPPATTQATLQVVDCPACRTRLSITGVSANGQIRCPHCHTVFVPADLPTAHRPAPAPAYSPPPTMRMPAIKSAAQWQAVTPQSGQAQTRTLIGTAVGQYQIESRLGEDSTGILYKAFDPRTGARVALRMLDPGIISRQDDYERWVSAEQAARELSHRNLQKILAMNAESGRPYLVMEYIEGDSLRKIMQRRGTFPSIDAVGILVQLGEALEYGASRGLLHGDLRPVHVLLGGDGVVRLSGLGIPKNAALNLRQVAGQFSEETLPLYTPPEVMIDPEQADERSDIYSLGAIAYHMLTVRPPHEGAGILQLGFRMAASKITPARDINPRIPEYVSKLIGRCLQLDANSRYDSPTLMLADLRRARSHLMAGEADAPELTDSLRTSNYVPVAQRQMARKSRLKRLKTHISRSGGHPNLGKRVGSGSGINAAVRSPSPGSSSGVRQAVPPLPPLPPLPPVPGGRAAASSSLNPAVVTRPMAPNPRGASSSSLGPGIVLPNFPRGAGSSSTNAAIPGNPSQSGSRENISDILDEVNPMAAPARSGAKDYEVVEQIHIDSNQRESERRAATGSRRQRAVRTTKRFSNSNIVVTCIVSAIVLAAGVAGIYYSYAGSSTAPVVEHVKIPGTSTEIMTDVPPLPGVEESSDWRIVDTYMKDNPKETKEIVKHLRYFLGHHATGDHVKDATEKIKHYSGIGAKDTIAAARDSVHNFTTNFAWDDANKVIDHWRDDWKEGADTAALETSLRGEVTDFQKSTAQKLLDDALQLRKDQKYADAKALYERVRLHFPAEFTPAAAKGTLDSDAEEKAVKEAMLAEEKARKAEEGKEARNAAAPAALDRAVADYGIAMKTFDFFAANGAIEYAQERVSGTTKEADMAKLKAEFEGITALRDRMVKAVKNGKIRDVKIKYHSQECQLPDASADGPVLQVGAGTVPIKWSQVAPDDLAEIGARATEDTDGPGQYHLGVMCYYLGRYLEAFQALNAAQKLKVDAAAHFIELTQTAMKEQGAADDRVKQQAVAEQQAQTVKVLADAKLEIRKGIWRATPNSNVYSCSQDPNEQEKDLMSLQRKISRSFKSISIEVRGNGDAGGLSFSGKGRRFLVKPNPNWQKITVERGKDEIVLRVNDDIQQSIEKIGSDVTPSNLVAADGMLYIRFVGIKGEFRNLQVDE